MEKLGPLYRFICLQKPAALFTKSCRNNLHYIYILFTLIFRTTRNVQEILQEILREILREIL